MQLIFKANFFWEYFHLLEKIQGNKSLWDAFFSY
jgi:hypothetical protein